MAEELASELGDYMQIVNNLPQTIDLETDWGMELVGKVRDFCIDEANKLKEVKN